MLPLPVSLDGDTEAVVDVVGNDGAGVVAGLALPATTAVVVEVEEVELTEIELGELVVEAVADVADATQAHTELPAASTARPVTAPQPLRTLERAAVLIATANFSE